MHRSPFSFPSSWVRYTSSCRLPFPLSRSSSVTSEQPRLVPLLILTPLIFLGGSFYSVDMLPPFWQTVSLFNPVVYLISGFRWSFYGISDVSVGVSLTMTILFLAICLATVWWI